MCKLGKGETVSFFPDRINFPMMICQDPVAAGEQLKAWSWPIGLMPGRANSGPRHLIEKWSILRYGSFSKEGYP